jgi:hypothetical protein
MYNKIVCAVVPPALNFTSLKYETTINSTPIIDSPPPILVVMKLALSISAVWTGPVVLLPAASVVG